MSSFRKGSIVVLGLLAALSVAVTAAFGGPEAQSATTVAVTAGQPSEFRFIVKPKTVPKGIVTFKVANRGMLSHDFKIAGKKTATLAKGKATTLRITFKKAGRYPYLCTLPSHATAGMKGVLVVK